MRVVFMGTPEFAVASLNKLIDHDYDVLAVVTVPDRPKGRGLKLKPSPVKLAAEKSRIPLLQPEKLNDPGFIKKLKNFDADAYVVVAFRILPREVFTIPKFGTINVHASLLPLYRGAAPINWAIINGDTKTGVTTMRIDERIDTGNIFLQKEVPITENMTAGELHDVLALEGAELLHQTLIGIHQQDLQPFIQNNLQATRAPKINKETCHINFNRPARDVLNLIRGLSPYPAAHVFHNNNQIKIYRAQAEGGSHLLVKPGTIAEIGKDYFRVNCAEGSILVNEVRLQGKKQMSVKAFFNGYKMKPGEELH